MATDRLFESEEKMPAALLLADNLARTTHIKSARCITTAGTSGSKFIIITLPQSSSAEVAWSDLNMQSDLGSL